MASVLIIDDHQGTLDTCSTVLRLAGFETATAVNGRVGIELALTRAFDVHLVDLCLPDMSGIDVVRELRQHGCRGRLIIVTAFSTCASSFQASAAGADGYVEGPLFGDDVIDVVEHARLGPWPVNQARAAGDDRGKSRWTRGIDPRVRVGLQLIDRDLRKPWSNAEIAAVVGLSESRWRYLFHVGVGVSMVAHVRERRLQEVARRLRATTANIGQIANQVGFASLSLADFRRAFRDRFGMSPTEYRRTTGDGRHRE
jgi:AraC-like DNA-binding protein/ActR/RegA family two-component response regulator